MFHTTTTMSDKGWSVWMCPIAIVAIADLKYFIVLRSGLIEIKSRIKIIFPVSESWFYQFFSDSIKDHEKRLQALPVKAAIRE